MNTLQNLRKEAGYRTAREFADEIGVSIATYSRYEQAPGKIPTKNAWMIADRLGCSIDAIVGREHIDTGAMRGEVQKLYDKLSESSRFLFDEFCEFIIMREAGVAKRQRAAEETKYMQYMRYFEYQFLMSMGVDQKFEDLIVFSSQEEERSAFRSFIEKKIPKKSNDREQGNNSAEVISKIMEAYDRSHGTIEISSGFKIDYSIVDMRSISTNREELHL